MSSVNLEPFSLASPVVSRRGVTVEDFLRHFGGCLVRKVEGICDPELHTPELIENPQWERFGFRGQVAKLLFERGLKGKAVRFANCGRLARPGSCKRYPLEHKFYVPHGCEAIFCRECAQQQA